jgi:hypothetical protein
MDQKMSQSLLMISEVTPKELRRTQNVDLIMVKGLWQGMLELAKYNLADVSNVVGTASFSCLAACQRIPGRLQIRISLLADME